MSVQRLYSTNNVCNDSLLRSQGPGFCLKGNVCLMQVYKSNVICQFCACALVTFTCVEIISYWMQEKAQQWNW